MILPDQTLIRNRPLAKLLGIDPSTLNRWTVGDPRVRRCLFRRGYYSIARLREAGLIPAAAPPAPSSEGVGHVG